MGYFKNEEIEEIEMQLQDQLTFSTFKEFYLRSEMQLEELPAEEAAPEIFAEDRWTLSLFDQSA